MNRHYVVDKSQVSILFSLMKLDILYFKMHFTNGLKTFDIEFCNKYDWGDPRWKFYWLDDNFERRSAYE